METIFAQIAADAWQVHPDDVVITLADTAAIAIGFGTLASRTTVTLSAAIHGASERLRAKVFSIAANMLECDATDLELRNGKVGIMGVPGAELPLAGRRASMPVSRRLITSSRRRSPGPTRCMRSWWKWTPRPGT